MIKLIIDECWPLLLIVSLLSVAACESRAQATVRMATEDYVTNRVAIATNALPKSAHTGEYSDLKNLPPLPPTPQAMTNIAETVTGVATGKLATVAHTGDYEDLTNVPEIPDPEEKDLRAWRLYHYGDPDIVESPAEWFQFDPATGTITGFVYQAGREEVVIPWAIGGIAVTSLGDSLFFGSGPIPISGVMVPKSVTSIGSYAFMQVNISTLSLPGVTSIGDLAFMGADIITLNFSGDFPSMSPNAFAGSNPDLKIYVDNPAATGWPSEVQGVPVVRLPLHTDNLTAGTVTLGGVERGTWPTVDPQQVENIATAAAEQITTNFLQSVILDSDNWVTFEDGVQTWWHRDAQGHTNEVWRSDQSGAELAIEVQQLRSQVQTLTTQLESALAWGDRAPDGSDNPDPEYMVLLNRPATMHMSGYQWQTYGTYAVLTTSGAVAFESGSDGGMRIGPDNENYFGFIGGGSVTVGAMAKSLHVEDGGTPEGEAYIAYEHSGGSGFPILWYSPDLREVPFAEQDGVVWVDNQDGTATATAPATGERGYWMATTTRQIDYVFNSTMPAFLQGGVIVSTNSVPVVYDSVIHVESGEKTFRIPAEEVQQ